MSPARFERFGALRSTPPLPVVKAVGGDESLWQANRVGSEGPFPNGGIWRVRQPGTRGASVVVKRTGVAHLGGDPVWAGAVDAADPQWWGREAAFYASDLAVTGWTGRCHAARCLAIDDHDDVRDLWLEDVDIPLSGAEYESAVQGLAVWQVRHRGQDRPWLSHGWIPAHLRRRDLDNVRTLDDPRWARLFEVGVPQFVRHAARHRVTDPATVERLLGELPQLLTHYDFHQMNLGRVGESIAIIDWATVGLGPVGHDVGVMLIDQGPELDEKLPTAWHHMVTTYAEALKRAGLDISPSEVERSAAISNVLRHGWLIDYVLDLSDQLSKESLSALRPLLLHHAELQRRYVRDEA